MSYRAGDAKALVPPCQEYQKNDGCCSCGKPHDVMDSRGSYERIAGMVALLPHSCGEWVIGGPPEVQAMIADLQDILAGWLEADRW